MSPLAVAGLAAGAVFLLARRGSPAAPGGGGWAPTDYTDASTTPAYEEAPTSSPSGGSSSSRSSFILGGCHRDITNATEVIRNRDDVRALQRAIGLTGSDVDGLCGSGTAAAYQAFVDRGRYIDGVTPPGDSSSLDRVRLDGYRTTSSEAPSICVRPPGAYAGVAPPAWEAYEACLERTGSQASSNK